MFARVTTFEGAPDRVDELARYAAERVLPALSELDGFNGLLRLTERQKGMVLAVSLWETEEAMRASEEAVDQIRSEAASETIAGVDRYEVTFGEVRGRQL